MAGSLSTPKKYVSRLGQGLPLPAEQHLPPHQARQLREIETADLYRVDLSKLTAQELGWLATISADWLDIVNDQPTNFD